MLKAMILQMLFVKDLFRILYRFHYAIGTFSLKFLEKKYKKPEP